APCSCSGRRASCVIGPWCRRTAGRRAPAAPDRRDVAARPTRPRRWTGGAATPYHEVSAAGGGPRAPRGGWARAAATGRSSDELLPNPPRAGFDRLARLAATLLRAPVALVSLVDADREVVAGCSGWPEPGASARQTPLAHSLGQHVVATRA